MNTLHKLKTLLTDLRDKIQRRQYHVRCLDCAWQVHNLEHERFARRRGQFHYNNAHPTKQLIYGFNGQPLPMHEVWHTRA